METVTISGCLMLASGLVTMALAGLIHWLRRDKIKGIPEPPGNFIFGHVFLLRGNFCKTFVKWKKLLGPVFQLRLLKMRVVVFNDIESISKVCAMPQASGRPRTGFFQQACEIIGDGIAFGEGPRWAEQRQLLIKSLKTFGVGRPETERRLQHEIADILVQWEELNGEPFELYGCNADYVFNALWSVVASKRLEHSVISHLTHHHDMIAKIDTIGHKIAILTSKGIGKLTNAVEEKRKGFEALVTVVCESLVEHQKDRVPNEPRDVIDLVLDKMDTTDDVNSAYHRNNFKTGFQLGDMIIGTIDTVPRTLEWFMFYLAINCEAASKLYAEIDRFFGNDLESWPSLADRENMPYTLACILEVLRISAVVPFAPPRKALEDFKFNGALIPKGTILVMNQYGVNYDPQTWDQPEKFEPERFLTSKGDNIDLNVKNKILIFGTGRRACPGYTLAMDSMFLYVVNVYRKFRFEVLGHVSSCEGKFGFVQHLPKGIQLRAITRVKN